MTLANKPKYIAAAYDLEVSDTPSRETFLQDGSKGLSDEGSIDCGVEK